MGIIFKKRIGKSISVLCSVIISAALFLSSSLTAVSTESMYIYNTVLNNNQREVYNQVYTNIIGFNEEIFKLNAPLNHDELYMTMNALYNDHPELFWVNTSYKYGYNSNNMVVQLKLNYCVTRENFATATLAFNAAIDNLVQRASVYPTELERERAIHDMICEMATYSNTNTNHQSAYSVFVDGLSVCAGYSRAFQLACQRLGILCYYVTGIANGEEHAWNVVCIGGQFYNVDITGDDTIGETTNAPSYQYFNVSDAQIAHNHQRSALSAILPTCNSL